MTITVTTERFNGDGVALIADHWIPPERPDGVVLLLHGGGQTRHSWRATGQTLAEKGWETYAIDARGHGESEWADDGDYSTAAHSRDIAAITSQLDARPVLVGASMGGMAALAAQASDPGLASGLVLVDVTPKAEPEGLEHIQRFMLRGLEGFDSIDDVLTAVVEYNPNRTRPPRKEGLSKNLRFRDGRWYWHWDPRLLDQRVTTPEAAAMRETETRTMARSITVPTLLIRGAQSDIVSEAGVQDLKALIPTLRHVDVAGAGHMVGGDDNDVFTRELVRHLDDLA